MIFFWFYRMVVKMDLYVLFFKKVQQLYIYYQVIYQYFSIDRLGLLEICEEFVEYLDLFIILLFKNSFVECI